MERFIIEGRNRLQGTVFIKGAKNSMLPIMAASVLNSSDGDIKLFNIPDIIDMHVMKAILESLGLEVSFSENTMNINTRKMDSLPI